MKKHLYFQNELQKVIEGIRKNHCFCVYCLSFVFEENRVILEVQEIIMKV